MSTSEVRGIPGLGASVLASALLMGAAGYAALYVAPTERSMGDIQRIFYFHMPSAIIAFIAFSSLSSLISCTS